MKRKKIIAGNWKMNKRASETEAFVDELHSNINEIIKDLLPEIIICAPFTNLYRLHKTIQGLPISLGAQNLHSQPSGAYTGEISGGMLKDIGASHVIVGHSERRAYFHETDDDVNAKVKAAINGELIPILCVGETLEQRENKQELEVIQAQLENGLKDLNLSQLHKILIAYEPVWAIGTGKTATPEIAQEVHAFIRSFLYKNFGSELASYVRILYGGSMKPENIKDLISKEDIDGGLIGGASLDPKSFAQLIKSCAE